MKPMIMSGLFMDDTVQMPEHSHGQSNMDGDYNWCQYNLISQVKSVKIISTTIIEYLWNK